jgi:titin
VISGNTGHGVLLLDATTTGNVVEGNFIGTNATASARFRTRRGGVAILGGSNGNTIGAQRRHEERHLVQRRPGVAVDSGTGNAILGNTISYNAALGIDLGPAGVTANDRAIRTRAPTFSRTFRC